MESKKQAESFARLIDEHKAFNGYWIGYLYCKKDSLTFSVENHYGIPGTDITKPVGEFSFSDIEDFSIDVDDMTDVMIDSVKENRPGELKFTFESGSARIAAGTINWMSYEDC